MSGQISSAFGMPDGIKRGTTVMFVEGMDFDDEVGTRGPEDDEMRSTVTGRMGAHRQEAARGKKVTKFQLFNLGVRKKQERKGLHPSYQLMKKIVNKDKRLLKDIMPKKMLLRVIQQVYQEKNYMDLNPVPGSESSQSLVEYLYDNFMHKYGLKNVAEKKFLQVISTCILQGPQVPRIRLFGRFLEVFDDLQPNQYNKYQQGLDLFTQQILNFKYEEDAEVILLPLNRAMEFFKLKFESKLTP
mmetsp:Transcript_1337/g.843  ORF Transcript_1337/g.843 Transcript_1337/m.843 type:complete len:243 (+) Transcript_1337:1135-1863(+)